MKTTQLDRIAVAAVAALGCAILLASAAPTLRAADSPLIVVIAATSSLQDISHGNLRRLFLGEPTSGSGGKLIPLNQSPGSAVRNQFDRVVLGLEPDDVARFWIDQRIRGQAGAPRAIPAAMLIRVVPQLAGAMGYVRAHELGAGMKAITIDGKKAGEAGYLLQ
jgi:hypothetical protein